MDRVGYEPVSVKAVLAEMKDTAELLIDLSFSAVLMGDEGLAEEVLALEERMDVLQLQARMSLMMAVRSPDDAEELAPVLGVVGAAEKVSDAAGDVAKVALEDVRLPEAMRSALPAAAETLVRARVAADSRFAGPTLQESNLETETGCRVIAVFRPDDPGGSGAGAAADDGSGDWLLDPGPETALRGGDRAILRGPAAGIESLYPELTGEPYDPPAPARPAIDDLGRAVDTIVLMKNTSELAVDLAYGSVLYDSSALAEEVRALEAEVDALKARFEAWTLRAAGRVEDPIALRGLVHLAAATEEISDAALEIAEGVLRGLGTHPVVASAVYESDEVIVRVEVGAGSHLDGATLGGVAVRTETGMGVIAVRRADPGDPSRAGGSGGGRAGDDGDAARHGGADGAGGDGDRAAADEGTESWVVSPGPGTRLSAGDVLLAKGTRSGAGRLADLAGDDREFGFDDG